MEFAALDPYDDEGAEDTEAPPAGPAETSHGGWSAADFRVAPDTAGRSFGLTEPEVAALRYEELMARAGNVPWQERGPANTGGDGDVAHWRGQTWRQGANGGTQRCSQEIHCHIRITFNLNITANIIATTIAWHHHYHQNLSA